MDPISRISLYQENQVQEEYLFRLYMEVACRPEALSIEESRSLNLETLVLIHQARERLRAQPPAGKPFLSPIRTDIEQAGIDEIVSSTFGLPLTAIDSKLGVCSESQFQLSPEIYLLWGFLDSSAEPKTAINGGSANGGGANTGTGGTGKAKKGQNLSRS